ncbi:MAG: CBS domain-containing protein [Planctomycetes bacterium]|nr:CBS domain-containing protein [Planctomycetota bacterium]MCB9920314.1 CBS domain-containing protein [Planctomycetota bacterium]
MKVHELMTPSPMTCRPTDSLHDVAQRLWNEDCGSLPVVDGRNRLVGMITDRDVAMAGYFRNRTLGEILVADTMSQKITSCAENDDVSAALDHMRHVRVHRLPVCDEDGTLRGIVAFSDVLRGVARDRQLTTKAVETLGVILEPRGEKSGVLQPAARAGKATDSKPAAMTAATSTALAPQTPTTTTTTKAEAKTTTEKATTAKAAPAKPTSSKTAKTTTKSGAKARPKKR